MAFYQWCGADLVLRCHLQPGARTVGAAGLHGDALKIRISAPPVDGKANEQLLAWLADAFAVAKGDVQLLSGHHSRQKRVRITAPNRLPGGLGIVEP